MPAKHPARSADTPNQAAQSAGSAQPAGPRPTTNPGTPAPERGHGRRPASQPEAAQLLH